MGQDFGNIPSSKFGYYDKSCDEFENENPDPYAEFDKNNTDVDYFFRFYGNDISKTDDNLRHLFKSIDYEDIRKNRYADLFFTNIYLMYRKGNESGGFKSLIVMKKIFMPLKIWCIYSNQLSLFVWDVLLLNLY